MLAGRFDWGRWPLSRPAGSRCRPWIEASRGRASVGAPWARGMVGWPRREDEALVLVQPSAMVLGSPRREGGRHIRAVVAGFKAGALPLAAVTGALAVAAADSWEGGRGGTLAGRLPGLCGGLSRVGQGRP